jgi:RecG-like helicase
MLRKLFQRLTVPMSEVDLARLREFCTDLPGVVPIGSAQARQDVTVAGEISSVRIVPRAGSPSLEATVSDGSGSIVAVWTGRRHLAGVCPGKRLVLSGRGADQNGNGRLVVLNPLYELL